MKDKIIGKTGHVISMHVIYPATVVKISHSGERLRIKYNKVIPFTVEMKDETSEIITYKAKPMMVYNEEYDADYPEFTWLKYKNLRLMVLKKEYIEIKPECEEFWKDEYGWRNEFNERFYLGEWCYADL